MAENIETKYLADAKVAEDAIRTLKRVSVEKAKLEEAEEKAWNTLTALRLAIVGEPRRVDEENPNSDVIGGVKWVLPPVNGEGGLLAGTSIRNYGGTYPPESVEKVIDAALADGIITEDQFAMMLVRTPKTGYDTTLRENGVEAVAATVKPFRERLEALRTKDDFRPAKINVKEAKSSDVKGAESLAAEMAKRMVKDEPQAVQEAAEKPLVGIAAAEGAPQAFIA